MTFCLTTLPKAIPVQYARSSIGRLPKAAALPAFIPGLSRVSFDSEAVINECGDRVRSLTEYELAYRDAIMDAYLPCRMIMGQRVPDGAVYTVIFKTTRSTDSWDQEDLCTHFWDAESLVQWFASYQDWAMIDGHDFSYLLFDVIDEPILMSSAFLPDLLVAYQLTF